MRRKINTRINVLAVLGLLLSVTLGFSGCKSDSPAANDASTADASTGPDPAAVNMAPVSGSSYAAAPAQGKVLGARSAYNPGQATTEEYPQQQTAPAPANGYPDNSYPTNGAADQNYDPNYESQVDAGQEALYADQPPPPLPVYDQPEDMNPNDIWTPGYWSQGAGGYYWVPGAWVAAPYTGALWTPGYWGYASNRYAFHHGFWGPHIGFYGGIPYGFGYTGVGYSGGYWNGNNFYYNRAVNRINVTNIHNVYVHNVTVVNNYNRVSYNGGRGGITVRPQAAEIAAMRGPRTPPMQAQIQAARAAGQNQQQFYSRNQGHPAIEVSARSYSADHVTPPANLQRVQQENQQRLEQMRGQQQQARPSPNQPAENRQGPPQRTVENPTQQRPPNHPEQNHGVQNQQVQREQQMNQQRTQENAQQQQRAQQENVQRQQQVQQQHQQQAVQQKQQEQVRQQQQAVQQRLQGQLRQQQTQPQPPRVQPRPETPVVRPQVEQRPQAQPRVQEARPQPETRAPAPQTHNPTAPRPEEHENRPRG